MKDIITGAKNQKQLRAAKQGKVRKAVYILNRCNATGCNLGHF
jgi:hypothetical protein